MVSPDMGHRRCRRNASGLSWYESWERSALGYSSNFASRRHPGQDVWTFMVALYIYHVIALEPVGPTPFSQPHGRSDHCGARYDQKEALQLNACLGSTARLGKSSAHKRRCLNLPPFQHKCIDRGRYRVESESDAQRAFQNQHKNKGLDFMVLV